MDSMEQDPLSQDLTISKISKEMFDKTAMPINSRGRPALAKKFCRPPKSIVSQLISKINSKVIPSRSYFYYKRQNCALPFYEADKNTNSSPYPEVIYNSKGVVCKDNNYYFAKVKSESGNKGVIYNLKNEKVVTCRICYQRFMNQAKLVEHLSSHKEDAKFSCDFPDCNYNSKLMSNLLKHKRIHTNEKPYLCDQCPFRTNFVNSLKSHKRTHTSERPYCCELCGHQSNSISNLKKHCLQKHLKVK